MTTYERLAPIFWEVMDDDTIELTPALTARDVGAWDSLSHIRLIVAVEQAFGISFATPEVTDLKNVGELVELIDRKLSRR